MLASRRTSARLLTAAAALTVGAGVLTAAPAAAQTQPFNLKLEGGVACEFAPPGQPWDKLWSMHRWMRVTNDGANPLPNVHLQEFGGESRFAEELKPGESMTIETRWVGCWPASISGYTISDVIDPLLDNIGFWANVESRDADGNPSGLSAILPAPIPVEPGPEVPGETPTPSPAPPAPTPR